MAAAAYRAAERDQGERLSADDQATQRDAEFLDRAILQQQARAASAPRARAASAPRARAASAPRARAASAPRARPGVCSNCGEACLPLAVYCDEDCRADHEARERRGR